MGITAIYLTIIHQKLFLTMLCILLYLVAVTGAIQVPQKMQLRAVLHGKDTLVSAGARSGSGKTLPMARNGFRSRL